MAKIIFGVWGDQVIDNRARRSFEIDEAPHFDEFDEFDHGNGIKAFFGWKGFFIFERDVGMLDAARLYLEKAASESCGKCTPCRVGIRILKDKFVNWSTAGAGSRIWMRSSVWPDTSGTPPCADWDRRPPYRCC